MRYIKTNLKNHFLLIFILLVYLGLVYVNIKYPGLNGEEADKGYTAFNIIKARGFPLMKHEYTGVILSYLLAPIVGLLGTTVVTLRLTVTLWILLGVMLAYKITKEWFGQRVAALFLLFVLSNVYFFQTIKLGFFIETTILFTFLMGSTYLLWRYFSSGRKNRFLLFLGALLLGLGLCQKINFLYYIIAGIVCYFSVGRGKKIRAGEIKYGLAGFIIGCTPLILYNIINGLPTFKLLSACLLHNTRSGISNFQYANNLWIRFIQLCDIMRGNIIFKPEWGIYTKAMDFLSPAIFFMSLIWVVARVFFRPPASSPLARTRISMVCLYYFVVFMLTPFTVSNLAQYHLLIIFPFPWLIMSLFMNNLIDGCANKRFISRLPYFLIAAIVSLNLLMNLLYSMQMRSNKDKYSWYWNANIYNIAEYLNDYKIRRVGVFVWEVHKNLQFLSGDRVFPWLINTNNFKSQPFETFEKQAYNYICQQCFLPWSKREGCYILISKNDYYYYDEMGLLKTVASNYKKNITVEKEFISEGDRTLLYRLN